MISDFCENGFSADIPQTNTGVCNTSADIHNYYQWDQSGGSSQTYSIFLRWRIPDNFASWATNPLKVYAKRTDATVNAVNLYVYGTDGTVDTGANGTQVAGTAAWTQTTVSSLAGTYATSSYMTIRLDMIADTGTDTVEVGEIDLEYRSSN